MKSKLQFTLPDVTIIENDKKDEIILNTDDRIKMCLKPIHFAAYLLDPTVQGTELDEEQEGDAMEYIYDVGQRLGLKVMANLAFYRAKDGFWSRRFLWDNTNDVSAVTWWKGLCGSTALSKVAVRILTAPCTSAAVERSFSAHNNTHSKKRNRLTTERAAKLAFITYNWNLLNKYLDDVPDDCVPDSPPVPMETQSPEPSTSGLNRFEFLDCNRISDSDDDE